MKSEHKDLGAESSSNALIIISGALNTGVDMGTVGSRLTDTIQTLKGIRALFPKAELCYVDGGLRLELLERQSPLEAIEPLVNRLIDLTTHPRIVELHRTLESTDSFMRSKPSFRGYSKSRLEATSLALALERIETHRPFHIKFSARYKPTRKFKANFTRLVLKDSWQLAFRKSELSYLRPQLSSAPRWRRTVAWFSNGLSNHELKNIYEHADELMLDFFSQGNMLDLEHALFVVTTNYRIHELRKLGISGIVASSSRRIRL